MHVQGLFFPSRMTAALAQTATLSFIFIGGQPKILSSQAQKGDSHSYCSGELGRQDQPKQLPPSFYKVHPGGPWRFWVLGQTTALHPGAEISKDDDQGQKKPPLKWHQRPQLSQLMDVPQGLHTSRGDPGKLRAHGDSDQSQLHRRRNDSHGCQTKSSLTEHNAMP